MQSNNLISKAWDFSVMSRQGGRSGRSNSDSLLVRSSPPCWSSEFCRLRGIPKPNDAMIVNRSDRSLLKVFSAEDAN